MWCFIKLPPHNDCFVYIQITREKALHPILRDDYYKRWISKRKIQYKNYNTKLHFRNFKNTKIFHLMNFTSPNNLFTFKTSSKRFKDQTSFYITNTPLTFISFYIYFTNSTYQINRDRTLATFARNIRYLVWIIDA